MRKNKRYRQQKWIREMTAEQVELLLKDCYQQALRIGSIRAVEDRRNLGHNRLYRWVHANSLPTIRRRKLTKHEDDIRRGLRNK